MEACIYWQRVVEHHVLGGSREHSPLDSCNCIQHQHVLVWMKPRTTGHLREDSPTDLYMGGVLAG